VDQDMAETDSDSFEPPFPRETTRIRLSCWSTHRVGFHALVDPPNKRKGDHADLHQTKRLKAVSERFRPMHVANMGKVALLAISFLLLLLVPCTVAARVGPSIMKAIDASQTEHIDLPDLVIGPESVAFDAHGAGPYVSVSDGRILRYGGNKDAGWATFSYSPSYTKNNCSSYTTSELPSKATESFCGRPLGMRFHRDSGYLYIADAYMGLMLATEAAGVPLSFTNGVDVDRPGHR
jgi:hypothetical protein